MATKAELAAGLISLRPRTAKSCAERPPQRHYWADIPRSLVEAWNRAAAATQDDQRISKRMRMGEMSDLEQLHRKRKRRKWRLAAIVTTIATFIGVIVTFNQNVRSIVASFQALVIVPYTLSITEATMTYGRDEQHEQLGRGAYAVFDFIADLEGGDVRTRLACRAEAMDEARYKSLVPRLEDEPVYLGWGKQHKRTILSGFTDEQSP